MFLFEHSISQLTRHRCSTMFVSFIFFLRSEEYYTKKYQINNKSITTIVYGLLQTDASVGTEMGTMTEPECIGPLDPGTSVTLEGIVWHETDGGIVFILIICCILD